MRAILSVANIFMGKFELPPGFEEVWSREVEGGWDIIIEGPFPPGIKEDDKVGVKARMFSPKKMTWTWTDVAGREVGEPIEMDMPPLMLALKP